MRHLRLAHCAALAATALGLGCDAAPPAQPASASASGSGPTPPSAMTTSAQTATTSAPKEMQPTKPIVRSIEGLPEGVKPLTADELTEMDTKCEAFHRAFQEANRTAPRAERGAEAVAAKAKEALGNTPEATRCADLAVRYTLDYLTSKIEEEASQKLGAIAKGLAAAVEGSPSQWCPSAPLSPQGFELKPDGPRKYQPDPGKDFQEEGWKCLKLTFPDPIYYRYEVSVDAKAKTFTATAKGYPVEGGKLSVLVLEGKEDSGKLTWGKIQRK